MSSWGRADRCNRPELDRTVLTPGGPVKNWSVQYAQCMVVSSEPPSRHERKHQAIAEAATELFLTNGYTRTSMDDIARQARVSKQTIYMHFGDKERLLFEIVTSIMTAASDPFDHEIHRLGESDDLDADLRAHARQQLVLVMAPRPLQLRRLVTAEAVAFPELGQLFYERGPELTISNLAAAFRRLHERSLLVAPDSTRAASDFNWLILGEPMNRAMLLGIDDPLPAASLDEWADGAAQRFLAAYRPVAA